MKQQPEILFLYASKSVNKVPSDKWKLTEAGGRYAHYAQDGFFCMFEQLLKKGIISKLTILFESKIEPGNTNFVEGADSFVIPRLNPAILQSIIKPNTIIFSRGVSKHWVELLEPYQRRNWLLIYGANTHKERWRWWDIIFDDINLRNETNRYNQYFFPFLKPINANIFKCKDFSKKFDICIGASYIHENKGQHRAVQFIEEYHKRYGYYPKCIMPGYVLRSSKTTQMLKTNFIQNECVLPGRQNRNKIAEIFNQSKIFIHLGMYIQNDTSLAEAWACGCKLIFAAKHRFSPYYAPDHQHLFHYKSGKLSDNLAMLHNLLTAQDGDYDFFHQRLIAHKYQDLLGFQKKVMPRIELLFQLLGKLENGPSLENRKKLPIIMQSQLPLLF